jgi:methionine-rich copper-binding protein CopC
VLHRFPALVLLSTAALYADSASAHARLSSSTPAQGAAVTVSPPAIKLAFTEGLEPAFSHMSVTSQSGQAIVLEAETVSGDASSELSAKPASPLSPGSYTVRWTVLSKDGHKTSGSIGFSVLP